MSPSARSLHHPRATTGWFVITIAGIEAALIGWNAWRAGQGGRYDISLRGVCAAHLHDARTGDPDNLARSLAAWAQAEGQPFPDVIRRAVTAPVAALGADNSRLLAGLAAC